MYSPLSTRFERRIRESGMRKTVVDVYYDGMIVAEDLAVSEGNIRVDLDGQVRRTGSITIADPRLVPTLTKTLSPLGAEIRVRQGLVYANGEEELIPLGVFRLDVTSWSELERVPSIQIYDRSKAIQQAKLANYWGRPGRLAKSVITEILGWFYPSLAPFDPVAVFDTTVADYRLPGGHVFDTSSHWDAIDALAKNMGGSLYFDVEGFPRVGAPKQLSPTAEADLEIDSGGILVDASHSHSREDVFNSVTVIGAARTNGYLPRGSVYNNNPASPLRWGGPFGKACDVINDSSLTTVAQCLTRANVELAKYTGPSYSLDFSSVPNPALDVGDIVRFTYPDSSTELHQISSLSIPLGAGTFTGTSRGVYLDG